MINRHKTMGGSVRLGGPRQGIITWNVRDNGIRVASNSFQWNQKTFGNNPGHHHHHNQSVGDEEDDGGVGGNIDGDLRLRC